jgi:hypothetical protein
VTEFSLPMLFSHCRYCFEKKFELRSGNTALFEIRQFWKNPERHAVTQIWNPPEFAKAF